MTRFLVGGLMLAACSLLAQSPSQRPAPDIEFVKIAAGEFMMGCSSGDSDCNTDEKPQHRVRITRPFEIGKYEVTQAEWQSVMGSNPTSTRFGSSALAKAVS